VTSTVERLRRQNVAGIPALLLLVGVLLPSGGAALQADTSGAGSSTSAASPSGSELRVWLITIGQGDAVWERFGHNAIRVVDTLRGTDLSYNWGIFDFDQVDFIPRFLRGEMLYTMAPFPTGRMLQAYAQDNREVVLQELELTPTQRAALRDYVDWNALPENRDYFYDYFLDNCSTRVRDVLDRTLGGLLAERFGDRPTGTSYRTHIRRLTAEDPLLFTGMDLLLGSPGDRPISVWEEMFVPMTLRDAIREVTVIGDDGVERPLVRSEEVAIPATRAPERDAPPRRAWAYLVLGVLLGGLFYGLGRIVPAAGAVPGAALAVLGGAWSLLAGVGGVLLVAVLFTDHHFMYWNETILQVSPLSLGVLVLLPRALLGGRRSRFLPGLAWTVVGLSVLGVLLKPLPGFIQDNTILVLLALPAHVGLALAASRLSASPAGRDAGTR
jgi:hypothetical protein